MSANRKRWRIGRERAFEMVWAPILVFAPPGDDRGPAWANTTDTRCAHEPRYLLSPRTPTCAPEGVPHCAHPSSATPPGFAWPRLHRQCAQPAVGHGPDLRFHQNPVLPMSVSSVTSSLSQRRSGLSSPRFATGNAELQSEQPLPSARSATATTTLAESVNDHYNAECIRGPAIKGRGRASKKSNSPPRNGSTGTTTIASQPSRTTDHPWFGTVRRCPR
ncbi:hypothetical protein HD592_001646 [Schaalia hyovaginalis]|uniref:Uncharacterized protein n=1 Tax=Schaalia hyovaginalis TaxID=29316 RepID=A0A923E309_9ACTO|nr:hypothetical protein [Schaalia hyovaginalis]